MTIPRMSNLLLSRQRYLLIPPVTQIGQQPIPTIREVSRQGECAGLSNARGLGDLLNPCNVEAIVNSTPAIDNG